MTKYFYRLYTLDFGKSYITDIIKIEYETIGNKRNTKITDICEKFFTGNPEKNYLTENWSLSNFTNYSSILCKMNYPEFGPAYKETKDKYYLNLFNNKS